MQDIITPPQSEIEARIETNTVVFLLRKDQILEVTPKKNAVITLEEAQDNWEKMQTICAGQKRLVVVIPEEGVSTTKEGREFSASAEVSVLTLKEAIVVTTFAHKLFASVFVNFHKPQRLTKVFPNRADAEAWLSSED